MIPEFPKSFGGFLDPNSGEITMEIPDWAIECLKRGFKGVEIKKPDASKGGKQAG